MPSATSSILVFDPSFVIIAPPCRGGVTIRLPVTPPFREVSRGGMLVAVAADPQSATEASDAALAGRVREGDRAAEAELFRRLAPRVRLYGLRHLRDPAAAADLVQDVLLMTFDSLRAGKVREDERLASYVLGTCRRMAIALARSTAPRQRLLERFGPELAPAAWTLASPSLDLDRLVSCLERLAERERTVASSPPTCAWCATARWRACAGAWRRGRDSRLVLPRAAGPRDPRRLLVRGSRWAQPGPRRGTPTRVRRLRLGPALCLGDGRRSAPAGPPGRVPHSGEPVVPGDCV